MLSPPASRRRIRSHLRLVHPCRPILTREQLGHFATPKTWVEILALDPTMKATEWRDGVIDADPHGIGLLRYIIGPKVRGQRAPEPGAWVLTDKGRAYVARTGRAA